MGQLIDGKRIAACILEDTADSAARLTSAGIQPALAVVLVGDDGPSRTYVRNKERAARKVGIAFERYEFPASISENELLKQITQIQTNPRLSGLIVQLPLPPHIDSDVIVNAIDKKLDVDCLRDDYFAELEKHEPRLIPPTPGAIIAILENIGIHLKGKQVAVLGRGKLVGRPIALILHHRGARVTVCHSKTPDTADICRGADIIISGVGKKHMIRDTMVKRGAIVIDAGTVYENGKMYGDVDIDSVRKRASFVTPTPGGVGPVTVACLLRNVVFNAQKKNHLPA